MIDIDGDLAMTRNVLDAMSTRARATLHNIANQNTPGFKRYEVRFEDLLDGQDGRVAPEVVRDASGDPEVNNVDVMEELTVLMRTRLMQDIFTRRAAGYFDRMRTAIRGHGG